MHMEMNIGNITTIATWVGGFIFPYLTMYDITRDQLTAVISGIIIVAWLVLNSKYPNSMDRLGNNINQIVENNPQVLNDEYE